MRSIALTTALMLSACSEQDDLTAKQRLGEALFFDQTLSLNQNQACAICHADAVGWTGPDEAINDHGTVYEGSVPGRFGNRKPPASAYAPFAPSLTVDEDGALIGGNFWDARATGWLLGSPAADQAQGPFLNPAEQALPDAATLVAKVCGGALGGQFRAVWGADACLDVERAFANVARSIADFEASSASSAFSSKYDAYLAGRATLDADEQRGLALFEGKAQCARCHPATRDEAGDAPLFTDFTFDNLGVPKNPENPIYAIDGTTAPLVLREPTSGPAFIDTGVGHLLDELAASDAWRTQPFVTESFRQLTSEQLAALAIEHRGKQRVPTLRNVDRRPTRGFVKAYTHNGYFKSLESLVHFYNTRDVLPRCAGVATDREATSQGCWPPPEVGENVNRDELGDLGLSVDEEAAIVAFLRTLSDGFGR